MVLNHRATYLSSRFSRRVQDDGTADVVLEN